MLLGRQHFSCSKPAWRDDDPSHWKRRLLVIPSCGASGQRKLAGYDVELRYVALENVALNIQRVRARAAKGGHFIKPGDIRRRYAASLENLPAALAIVDRAILADNSGAMHRVVLEITGQQISRMAPDLPGWLMPLMPRIRALAF